MMKILCRHEDKQSLADNLFFNDVKSVSDISR